MNSDHDDEIDQLLSRHLRRRLDPQVGGAAAAFAKAAGPDRLASSRRRLILTIAIPTGSIAAAIAFAFVWPLVSRHGALPRVDDPPGLAVAPPTAPAVSGQVADEPDFERLVMWRAVDEGAQVINKSVPVRRVRYEALEQIEWEDQAAEATIQLTRPVAEVVLVQQQTF